jgi:hypothetical protein
MVQTRSMTLYKACASVIAATLLSGHVAPSVDDNNRYLKVTPMRDGIRIAYTVFFGQVPGAAERRTLDRNRDGRIDAVEAQAFGDRVATDVAATLRIDGVPSPVRWATVDVGLGTDAVAAGAFSVDMIAYICAGSTRALRLRDGMRIARPGETEVKVEDSPGVTISRARIGAIEDPGRDYRFVGPGGPLADDGLELAWSAEPSAPALPEGSCAARPAQRSSSWLAIVAVAIAALATAGLLAWRIKRREEAS